MEETNHIPAGSKRQAMDWSLALISQGIESRIEYFDETRWQLVIEPGDYEQALVVLRQYRSENRKWPWQRRLIERGRIFDPSSLAWGFLLCFFYIISHKGENLKSLCLMDSAAVAHGQWWRLFTAIELHADLAHLAGNATIGIVLLGLAMARYGTGVALLASYLAGVAGNTTALISSAHVHRSLGASGMVMGALGLLAVHSLHSWQRMPRPTKFVVTRLVAGVMLFVLLGVAPGSDVLAHAGGFVAGVLLGSIVGLRPTLAENTVVNLLSVLIVAWLMAWTWWLALR